MLKELFGSLDRILIHFNFTPMVVSTEALQQLLFGSRRWRVLFFPRQAGHFRRVSASGENKPLGEWFEFFLLLEYRMY